MKLVIVESPTKTHTLKRYLGDDFDVEASKGHIRDLAIKGKNGFGVDVENDFKPTFVVVDQSKARIISSLKQLAKKSDEVILATDPDREGEAIAWHLASVLNLPIETTKRLEFHEITRESITEAMKSPRTINMNMVYSQETRRIIDRIIGFSLSKITYHALRSKSAGRVQSVTLKLICDHEKEIQSFVPQKYFVIEVNIDNDKLEIALDKYKGNTIDRIFDENLAKEIFNNIGNKLIVSNIEVKQREIKSKEPFTTSTLQQEAFSKLHFSTRKTMMIAQNLYEGIQINEEDPIGLITYMRTDSSKLSTTFIERAKNFIVSTFGEKYFSGAKSAKHSQNAQEAHEAIRHTGNHRTPESIKAYLTSDQYKLYKLIYDRALASLMTDKIEEVSNIYLSSNDVLFKTQGIKTIFDGFSKVYQDEDDDKDQIINLKLNDSFNVIDKKIIEEMTKPAPRYSEAKVVKLMEEKGIGRPSTYAPTIQILLLRKYVTSEKGILTPTEQGMKTAQFLEGNFSNFINVAYTAEMENKLDEIQAGNDSRSKILHEFYDSLMNEIDSYNKDPKVIIEKVEPVKTGEKCPLCGSDLVIREGRYGKFVGCSNFPKCKYIKKEPKKELVKVGRQCPKCGGDLVYRDGRKGRFISCSNFPKCKYTESIPDENKEENAEHKHED